MWRGWWENESARDLLGVSGASFLKNSQSSQILNRKFLPAIDYRLASAINPPASPLDQPPSSVGNRVLRQCLRSTTDLRQPSIRRRCQRPTPNFRGCCILRLHCWLSLRLASGPSSSSFPVEPTSNPSSTIALSGCTFRLSSSLRRRPVFRFCLWTGFRLSPSAAPPASPWTNPPTRAGSRIHPLCLPIQLPTHPRNLCPPVLPCG